MKRVSASIIFLFSFGLNLFLAFPSLSPFRDAGDFGAAVAKFGVAHPPGYPLYVLLGKSFHALLPWGNSFYRLNIFSALCAAFAATFIFAALVRPAGRFAGAAGALLFLLLPAVLAQAGLSEVYALNAVFAAGILYLIMTLPDFSPAEQGRRWILLSFVLGIGCGNHQTLLALAPVAAMALFREWRIRRLRPGLLIAMACLFAAGFSINLASLLRAAAGAQYVWGEPGTFGGILDLLTRADYGAATLSTRYSAASPDQSILFWFKSWMEQWGISGVLLWLAGALWAFRRAHRGIWGGMAWTLWILSGPAFGLMARLGPGELSRAILEPALILPGIAAAVMAGFFLGEFWRRGGGFRAAAVAVLLGHLFFYGVPAVFQHRQRQNFVADDYGTNLFRTLPSRSVLLMISDGAIFSALSRQEVFRERTDIRLLVDAALPWRWRQYRQRYTELFAEGQGDGGRELAKSKSGTERIFTEGLHPDLVESLCPHGMADVLAWPARDEACVGVMEAGDGHWLFYARRVPPPEVLAADYYSRSLAKTAASNAYNAGLLLRQAGREESAQRSFARALFWSPERWMRWTELY